MNLVEIQLAVEQHRAVVHPLIKRLSRGPNDRRAWQVFAAQHHHIVREFPYHIQALFQRLSAPEQELLFPVLGDEFPPGALTSASGEAPDFSAHAELQLRLCRSLGTEPARKPLPAIAEFIRAHREIAREAPIPFALGAFGPGHEYAVPVMFRQLVSGAPPDVNPQYLFEHLTIDIDHARRFLEVLSQGYSLSEVLAGARASLDLRARAWDAILDAIPPG